MMNNPIQLTARFSANPFPAKNCFMQSERSTGFKLTQELKAAKNGWYTPEELVELIRRKHGVTLGHHLPGQKKKSSFLYTNVLALDFDNDVIKHPEVKEHIIYPEAAIKALQAHGLTPNIVYATPSSDYPDRRNGKVKFRIVLFFNGLMSNVFCVELMHKSRGKKYPASLWWECCKSIFGLPEIDTLAAPILDKGVCQDFTKNLYTTDRLLHIDLNHMNSVSHLVEECKKHIDASISTFQLPMDLIPTPFWKSINPLPMNLNAEKVQKHVQTINYMLVRTFEPNVVSNIKQLYLLNSGSHSTVDSGEVEGIDEVIRRNRVSRWWPTLREKCIVARKYEEGERMRYFNSSMPFLSMMASWAPKTIERMINNHPSYTQEEKSERQNYIRDHREKRYRCWACKGNCDFYDECKTQPHNVQDIVLERRRRHWIETETPQHNYIDRDYARKEFDEQLGKIMLNHQPGIHVLHWETGSGKSHLMQQYVEKDTLYACPTHERKWEVYEALCKEAGGVLSVGVQPDPPELSSSVPPSSLKELDLSFSEIVEIIEEVSYSTSDLLKSDLEKIRAYGDRCARESQKQVYVCTIAKAHQHVTQSRWRTIMFDEDPAPEYMYSCEVSLDALYTLGGWLQMQIELYKFTHVDKNFQQFRRIQKALAEGHKEVETNGVIDRDIKRLVVQDQMWSHIPVISVLAHQTICLNRDPHGLHHSTVYGKSSTGWLEKLKAKKTIIASATPEPMYSTREDINIVRQSRMIHKQGTLVCFHGDTTFSRQAIENHVDQVRATMKKYQRQLEIDCWITFSRFVDGDGHIFGDNELVAGAWFFNAKATNKLAGKHIGIWGTPRIPAGALRKKAKQAGKEYLFSGVNRPHRFERHGVEVANFWSTATSQEELEFQLNCIEEELLQAVGRARQINHACNVYVFSDLPMQARTELREIAMESVVAIPADTQLKIIPVDFRNVANASG